MTGLMTIGLPSGKSLEEATIDLLKKANVKVRRAHQRSYDAALLSLPGFKNGIFMKPSALPALVADGTFPVAITGADTVNESGALVEICAELPYSKVTNGGTRCVLFDRGEYGTGTEDNLKKVFGKTRTERGKALPIIYSEYPESTVKFLKARGLHAQVFPCAGSAETLVAMGRYDYGVALTETGTSLRVNGLREITTIFHSTTVIIVNKTAWKNPFVRDHVTALAEILLGVLYARDKILLKMNAPVSAVAAITAYLKDHEAALGEPTIGSHLGSSENCSIETVVQTDDLNELRMGLKKRGASGFLPLVPPSVT